MVPKDLGVSSAKELDGAAICFLALHTYELELKLPGYFRTNNISYKPLPFENYAEARQQYLAGNCDAFSGDVAALAVIRATFDDSDAHVILPEIISKEPFAPVVRHGDNEWADIVRWTLNALIVAEELGVTSST